MAKMKKNNHNKNEKSDVINKAVPRQKLIWIGLSIFLFIISISTLIYAFGIKSEIDAYDENLTLCSLELELMQFELDEKKRELTLVNRQMEDKDISKALEKVIGKGIEDLKKFGFSRPHIDITSDLIKHRELIPYKSTEKKLLRFMYRNQIYLLSPNRVLAVFGDGKTSGWLYLKYEVSEDRKISWKKIESYCPDCKK